MAISTQYTSPVMVNGYACRTCNDVARAEKNIDPVAGVDAKAAEASPAEKDPATARKAVFDSQAIDSGALADRHRQATALSAFAAAYSGFAPERGSVVDLSA